MNTEEKKKNEMSASEEGAAVNLNAEQEQTSAPDAEETEVEEKAPSRGEKIISGIKAALHEIRIGRRSIWGELLK